jgi:electron transfer flavoprotein alpha subunit
MLKLNQINRFNSILKRFKSTLVIVEHDNQKLNPVSLNTLTAATKLPKNESITCLVAGNGDCSKIAEEVASINGVTKVLVTNNPALNGFLPEAFAPLVVSAQKQFTFSHILVGSSAFGKNLLPRVGALLDSQPVSDIIGINDENTFVRTIYAGNAIQTIRSKDNVSHFYNIFI